MKKVVALTGNSLLVHGLASRLHEYAQVFDLRIIDLTAPDSFQQISTFRPEIIIFEKGDLNDPKYPSLLGFMNCLPDVILVELRLDDSSVKLIQSFQVKAATTDDLVKIFNTGSSNPPSGYIV